MKGSQRPWRLAVSGVGSCRFVSGFSNPPFTDTQSAKNHRFRLHALITSTCNDWVVAEICPLGHQKPFLHALLHN